MSRAVKGHIPFIYGLFLHRGGGRNEKWKAVPNRGEKIFISFSISRRIKIKVSQGNKKSKLDIVKRGPRGFGWPLRGSSS